jgi:hypothetical protein
MHSAAGLLVFRITQLCRIADPTCRVQQHEVEPDYVSVHLSFEDGTYVDASWPVDWLKDKNDPELWDILHLRTGGRISEPYRLHNSTESTAYRVVYNSDLIIRNPFELATLSVCYDEVHIPYTGPQTSWRVLYSDGGEFRQALGDEIVNWELRYRDLFDGGVLRRLSAPREQFVSGDDAIRPEDVAGELWNRFRGRQSSPNYGHRYVDWDKVRTLHPLLRMLGLDARFIQEDLARHLLRNDIDLPQIFINMSKRPARDLLVALEAKATFQYYLPKIYAHEPDLILELREKVADSRVGFCTYLLELSAGIEERIKEYASSEELEGFAEDVVQTKLRPACVELTNQLRQRAVKKGNKVVDALTDVLEIDARFASPKFLGEVLKLLGLLDSIKDLNELTNKYQAFKFVTELRAVSSRRAG